MSYNIGCIRVIYHKNFGLTKEGWAKIRDWKSSHGHFANCFHADETTIPNPDECDANVWDWKFFPFCGEGSGFYEGEFAGLTSILSRFTGEADLIAVWEGGDDFTGYRLRNGKVTEHNVEFKLSDKP